jgi:hypothetical protein
MKIKINGGTARDDEPALCLSCRFASIVQGSRANNQIVRCSRVETNLTFKVTSCTEYISRNHPSLYHMEDIAWVLRTDVKRNQIGFVRSKDLKLKDRIFFDEE